VPTSPDNPASEKIRAAWIELGKLNKPLIMLFSDSDPVTGGSDRVVQKLIPGTQGQKHTTIANGGHFLQEDQGEEVAQMLVAFIRDNP
jgi:haloalkane dehalogenase